jgi:DNA-binding MarR family transcriptional regulator
MKTYKNQPAPYSVVEVAQEILELLYWKLNKILDREGITMLQWAFMQRALEERDGVSFSHIIEVTGESKDNVRRAAASLGVVADVVVNPSDRRARKLVLTKLGRKRARMVFMRFEKELLSLLGATADFSQRAQQFRTLLWDASAYLAPSDLASNETIARSEENRERIHDDSLQFGEQKSLWEYEETTEDSAPF